MSTSTANKQFVVNGVKNNEDGSCSCSSAKQGSHHAESSKPFSLSAESLQVHFLDLALKAELWRHPAQKKLPSLVSEFNGEYGLDDDNGLTVKGAMEFLRKVMREAPVILANGDLQQLLAKNNLSALEEKMIEYYVLKNNFTALTLKRKYPFDSENRGFDDIESVINLRGFPEKELDKVNKNARWMGEDNESKFSRFFETQDSTNIPRSLQAIKKLLIDQEQEIKDLKQIELNNQKLLILLFERIEKMDHRVNINNLLQ